MNWDAVLSVFWSLTGIGFALFSVRAFATHIANARHYEEVQRDYWRAKILQALAEQEGPYYGETQKLDQRDLYATVPMDDMLDP